MYAIVLMLYALSSSVDWVKTQIPAETGHSTNWVHSGTDQSVRELNSFVGGPEHYNIYFVSETLFLNVMKYSKQCSFTSLIMPTYYIIYR